MILWTKHHKAKFDPKVEHDKFAWLPTWVMNRWDNNDTLIWLQFYERKLLFEATKLKPAVWRRWTHNPRLGL